MTTTVESSVTYTPHELSFILTQLTLDLDTNPELEPLHDIVSEAAAISIWKRDSHTLDVTAEQQTILSEYHRLA